VTSAVPCLERREHPEHRSYPRTLDRQRDDGDGCGSVTNDAKVTFGPLEALCDGASPDAAALVALIAKRLSVKVPKARLARALRVLAQGSDEWAEDSSIEFVTEDGPEIPSAGDYRSRLYVHFFDMDAERDRVVVPSEVAVLTIAHSERALA